MSSQPFQIFSSLRYDPALPDVVVRDTEDTYPNPLSTPYYLLPYHQERLYNAASHFNWKDALDFLQQDLDQFAEFLDKFIPDRSKPWRLRIVVDRNGDCSVESSPAVSMDPRNLLLPLKTPTISAPWQVFVDSTPTIPSAFTTHKTTSRENYTAARLRSGITSPLDPAEVLLVNEDGEVMEGSITTPYFRRQISQREDSQNYESEPEWVTPPLSSGGNAGTTRRFALARGFCVEKTIIAADLRDGEDCLLSNAVRGFIVGKIVIRR